MPQFYVFVLCHLGFYFLVEVTRHFTDPCRDVFFILFFKLSAIQHQVG